MQFRSRLHSSRALVAATLALLLGGGLSTGNIQAADQAPAITWGGDFRLRNEYFDNAFTLSAAAALHEQDYFRMRARLWLAAAPAPTLNLYARIAAEPRIWTKTAFVKQHTGTGTEERYALFDALNVKWKTDIAGAPVTLTVGRQDLALGEAMNWWLVFEGTPGDGSWSVFFDAARLTLDLKEAKTQLDFIGLAQRAHPDSALPILGSPSTYSIREQNERGFIAYVTNRSAPGTQLDAYFIYKQDRRDFGAGDNSDICTYGAKLAGQPSPAWRYSLEGAWQTGHKQDFSVKTPVIAATKRSLRASGANAKLTYLFQDPHQHQLSAVAEYLSGDDPSTADRDEMFDILWGRWPRFSELYIYSYTMETGGKIAQLNNLFRYGLSWSCTPVKGTSLSVTCSQLLAPESVPTRQLSAALFTRTGHTRGQLVQAILKRQFTKSLNGHLWAEWLRQGDFYTHRDTSLFLRAELTATF